ncbi:hypothetical protein L226DRAFT_507614 [Lentinus tigrinus ALCF2SS1-7]|uniref:uncharacterized protein n=1 Tax=Lentinus tigrinus ALCF2SS1-7 TaxID=1328758 RepID=UPI001165FD33|nr:hypothetical protein L226DRAFT_507614 [Lentinus tigrinus ALCF2SS1-7]
MLPLPSPPGRQVGDGTSSSHTQGSEIDASDSAPRLPPATPAPRSPPAAYSPAPPPKRPPIVLKVNRFGQPPQVCRAFEAKVASRDLFDTMVVTSPNMDYVPAYPVQSSVVHMYADGLWGKFEYSRFPQCLERGMWHVACIPATPCLPDVPAVLWTSLSPSTHWKEDSSIGFNGLGYITTDVQEGLLSAATSAIRRIEEFHCPANVREYGRMLVLILRQVLDRMRHLPSSPNVAIAVAAHVQRVCLELCGLRTYSEVVLPRLESSKDFSNEILPVVGAFAREASDAQNLTRVGVPTWFLQPLTQQLPVWRVVESRPWTDRVSGQEMNLPILQRTSTLVGVSNLTGNWQRSMLLTVSKFIAGSHLAPLSLAEVPEEEPPSKRPRTHVNDGAAVHLHMGASTSDSAAPEKKKRTHRGKKRGKGLANKTSQAADPGTANPRPQPSIPKLAELPHPSKTFTPSPWYDCPSVWERALRAASPVIRTVSSAMYFYPPPFLLDTVPSNASLHSIAPHPERARADEKVYRYLHNLARIRRFVRVRIFDPSLSHEPLTIAKWRAALWGDYTMKTHPPKPSGMPSDLRRAVRRQDERNGVTRLCSRVGQLRSYRGDESVEWLGTRGNLESIASDPTWRLRLIWESHETNYRAEIMALDTLLVHKSSWLEIQRWEREALVSSIWGRPSSAVTVIPEEQIDMNEFRWGSDELAVDTVLKFAVVMKRWPECPQGLMDVAAAGRLLPSDFKRIQELVVDFYVRTFVKHYSRLPVPPIAYPLAPPCNGSTLAD